MQPRYNQVLNGCEFNQQDLNNIGQYVSAAPDVVIAELLRLFPGTGVTTVKAILPYSFRSLSSILSGDAVSTVMPNGATGTVAIFPFTAVIGARAGTPASTAWSDIRTSIFVGGGSQLSIAVTLQPNSSGQTRWDLVYAAVVVDQQSAPVTRYVKSPTTKVVAPTAVSLYLNTTVSVGAVQGTPGASPTVPSVPADTGSTFYIPLAAVRVPNGFTSSSTVGARDVRDVAPVIPIDRHMGVSNIQPVSGCNDLSGTYATNFGWSASAGLRPKLFLPPQMIGGEQRIFVADLTSATETAWSHPPGSIVDASVDWRNRFFVVFFQVNALASYTLATDQNHTTVGNPNSTQRPPVGQVLCGNSFCQDNTYAASSATVFRLFGADYSAVLQSGSDFGLYVDGTSGELKLGANSTSPQVQLWMWIMASSPYVNV